MQDAAPVVVKAVEDNFKVIAESFDGDEGSALVVRRAQSVRFPSEPQFVVSRTRACSVAESGSAERIS